MGKGIDNQLYRAWGCDAPWRGANGNGTLVLRSNDKMLEGLYTVVIRISGNKDPMNDDDATLEIGYSPDQIMKDARGNVGIDYSYRILKSEQYTKLKARIKDGWSRPSRPTFTCRRSPGSTISPRCLFPQGKAGWSQSRWHGGGPGGRLSRLPDLYTQNVFAQSGGVQGVREHEDHVALYYALRRHADGMFNPRQAVRRHLQRLSHEAGAGLCRGPRQADGYSFRESEEGRKRAFDVTSAAMIKAVNTLVPQEVPPTSTELTPVDGVEIGPGGVALPGRARRDYGGDGQSRRQKIREQTSHDQAH